MTYYWLEFSTVEDKRQKTVRRFLDLSPRHLLRHAAQIRRARRARNDHRHHSVYGDQTLVLVGALVVRLGLELDEHLGSERVLSRPQALLVLLQHDRIAVAHLDELAELLARERAISPHVIVVERGEIDGRAPSEQQVERRPPAVLPLALAPTRVEAKKSVYAGCVNHAIGHSYVVQHLAS